MASYFGAKYLLKKVLRNHAKGVFVDTHWYG